MTTLCPCSVTGAIPTTPVVMAIVLGAPKEAFCIATVTMLGELPSSAMVRCCVLAGTAVGVPDTVPVVAVLVVLGALNTPSSSSTLFSAIIFCRTSRILS